MKANLALTFARQAEMRLPINLSLAGDRQRQEAETLTGCRRPSAQTDSNVRWLYTFLTFTLLVLSPLR